MLISNTMIDAQLAKIAETVVERKHLIGGVSPSPKRIFGAWKNLHQVGARHRAWRAMRTRRTLRKAVVKWGAWLEINRGLDVERAARGAVADAKRLSRALRYFRNTCAMIQRQRRVKAALGTLRTLTQQRPIERAWWHWRGTVRCTKSKAVFKAWAAAAKNQRRLMTAHEAISTYRKQELASRLWGRWRRRAGALTLARLFCAWPVIAPARRALGILQGLAIKARAEQQLRLRRLRAGLKLGFTRYAIQQRRSKSAASRARDHNRLQTLRTGMLRWLVRYRTAQSVMRWQLHVRRARLRAGIKMWFTETVLSSKTKHRAFSKCAQGLERNVARRRTIKRETAAAVAMSRHVLLMNGLKRWRARTTLTQQQQQSQDDATMVRRAQLLRQGLATFNLRTRQAVKVSRVIADATSSRQASTSSAAIFRWRERACWVRCLHTLELSARLYFRRQSLSAGLSIWRKRKSYVARVLLNARGFQLQRGKRYALLRLRLHMEKRRAARLEVWRAGVRAEAHAATSALVRWHGRAQARMNIATAVRIARDRRQTRSVESSRCSPLVRSTFGVLTENAQVRKFKRLVLRAWLSHSEHVTRAKKQASEYLLRSGLLGLRLWVRLSESRRERRSKASNHRHQTVLHAQFKAWKNKSFPLGVRTQWEERMYPCSVSGDATKGTGTQDVQGTSCLGVKEAARLHALGSSSGFRSLDLLRLPMIGWLMRRMLYAWRTQTEKEMRFRYIKDILPNNAVGPNKGPAIAREFLDDADTARRTRCNQGNQADVNSPRRLGLMRESKGYLALHMLNLSKKKALSCR